MMAIQRNRLMAVLTLFLLSLCLFPAVAQEPEIWIETFDDPDAPGWELWEGAEISDGVLRLREGARAWHPGDWSAHTIILRMRRAGMFGMEYASSEDGNYNLILGDDFVEMNRQHFQEVADLELYRPIPEPVAVPEGEWFELHLTRIGPWSMAGIDGVRVMEAYDPNSEPLPPGGLFLGGMDGAEIEIDEIIIIPWLSNGLDEPPEEGWHMTEDVRFEEGFLHLPGSGFFGGGGEWEELTIGARMLREGEGESYVMYGGHIVIIRPDAILILREEGEDVMQLAEAPLEPMLTADPDMEGWMYVDVVVREGLHTVLVNGARVLEVEDDTIRGGVGFETAGADLLVDWVNIGPPVPLWPETPGDEMAEGETPPEEEIPEPPEGEGTEPEPSECRITASDTVNVREGPSIENAVIDALGPGDEVMAMQRTADEWYMIDFGDHVGWVYGGVVQLHGPCDGLMLAAQPSNGEQSGGQPSDGGQPGGQPDGGQPGGEGVPSADLAVTDLFPHHQPQGKLHLRITNHGPDALQGVTVTTYCAVISKGISVGITGNLPKTPQNTFKITIAPGQTHEFPTNIDLDFNSYNYEITCEVAGTPPDQVEFQDPNPNNNAYQENLQSSQQQPGGTGTPSADLAVTDLFPHHQPKGKLHLRITNNGPDTLQGVTVSTYCGGIATDTNGAQTSIPAALQNTFNITISPGQTHEFPTNIDLDLEKFSYTLTCEVNNPPTGPVRFNDPDISNNAYQENFQAVLQAHIVQADLAVTDIFPQSLPKGDVYVRITNNGPDSLTQASVGLNCNAVIHTYKLGDPTTNAGSSSAISVTLNPGETKELHSGIGITDSQTYWYEFTCEVNLPLLDPNGGNNSYSETIPPPP